MEEKGKVGGTYKDVWGAKVTVADWRRLRMQVPSDDVSLASIKLKNDRYLNIRHTTCTING